MKAKIMAASTLALALFGGMNLAHADDGSFKFIGSLTEDACSISGDTDQTIDMGKVPTSPQDGNVAQRTFSIALKNCPETAAIAHVAFSAEASSQRGNGTNDAIKDILDDGTESANGFWSISSQETGRYRVDGTDNQLPIVAGDNNLEFIAKLEVNGGSSYSLESGTHKGTATYTITYE